MDFPPSTEGNCCHAHLLKRYSWRESNVSSFASDAGERPGWRRNTSVVAAIALLLTPLAGSALDLTGVLLHAADASGNVTGPVWHTASGYGGRPLGFTRWPPPGMREMPFPMGADGSLRDRGGRPALGLWPGSHVTHLFWQFQPNEFPQALILNLYFNGDPFTPGISILVHDRYGLTHFVPNPAAYTLAMDLSLAPNPETAEFNDGTTRARVTAAFFFSSSSSSPDFKQWRPTDFVNLDRVGMDRLAPDGVPDGVFIFQLDVLPGQPTSQPGSRPQGLPRLRSPLVGEVSGSGLNPPSGSLVLPPPPEPVAKATPSPPTALSERLAPKLVEPPAPTVATDNGTPQPTTPASTVATAERTKHPRATASVAAITRTQSPPVGTPTRSSPTAPATASVAAQQVSATAAAAAPTAAAERPQRLP